jgi:hypothetical protein
VKRRARRGDRSGPGGTLEGARALQEPGRPPSSRRDPRPGAPGRRLTLLDKQQYAEAEPLLLDGAIEKTKLEDHAWKALAELYEKTGAFSQGREHTTSSPHAPTPIPSVAPRCCAART